MNRRRIPVTLCRVAAALAVVATAACSGTDDARPADTPADTTPPPDADLLLSVTGGVKATVDDRYQSYNIEMVEVTGGYFWPPYEAGGQKVYRPPIDLASERLRNLAKGLGPAYIRVSGTWANSTYFDSTGTSGGTAPSGFNGVLTTGQWSGVGEFAKAVDGKVVTSFASNAGVRDANGVWVGDQARALLRYSLDHDVPLVAAEFYNEPSLNLGVPEGYDAASFVRDFEIFKAVARETMPDLRLVGPGSADDVTPLLIEAPLRSTAMLDGISPTYDAFSYHVYPKVSQRCGSKEGPDIALTKEFLERVESDKQYYEALRDKYEPKAPMWITETAEAACGGDRWASTFRDVIRYVDSLGRFADGDGDVVFHNTLAASDYGLIDEDGFVPRPDYWAGALWHRLMGTRVLEPPAGDAAGLTVYAHCASAAEGPATVYAVVNPSPTERRTVATPSGRATVYRLTGDLDSTEASLNGTALKVADDGTLPEFVGEDVQGAVEVAPASVTFVVDKAAAVGCS